MTFDISSKDGFEKLWSPADRAILWLDHLGLATPALLNCHLDRPSRLCSSRLRHEVSVIDALALQVEQLLQLDQVKRVLSLRQLRLERIDLELHTPVLSVRRRLFLFLKVVVGILQ